MKKSEFKKLTLDKAKKDLEKSKKDLFNLRFQQVNGQLTNTSKFNKISLRFLVIIICSRFSKKNHQTFAIFVASLAET